MKTGPNIKIVIHWIIVLSLVGLLLFYIDINPTGFGIFIGLLLLTLIINKTTYISIESDSLLITKRRFLFFPTFKFSINLNHIENLTIKDNGVEIPGLDSFSDFDTAVLMHLFSGFYFYRPRFELIILSKLNKLTEIKVNTQNSDLVKIKYILEPALRNRLSD